MSSLVDLKALSLQLYNKRVLVKITPESAYCKKSKASFVGYLVGRLWGEKIDINNKIETTVIGITIRSNEEDVDFLCSDIETLIELD